MGAIAALLFYGQIIGLEGVVGLIQLWALSLVEKQVVDTFAWKWPIFKNRDADLGISKYPDPHPYVQP